MPVNPTPTRQGTPRVRARAVLQAFGLIQPETLRKRILHADLKPHKINAFSDIHGRRFQEMAKQSPYSNSKFW
jgi:hypothetical protein